MGTENIGMLSFIILIGGGAVAFVVGKLADSVVRKKANHQR